jgi:hypothetical protein
MGAIRLNDIKDLAGLCDLRCELSVPDPFPHDPTPTSWNVEGISW